MLDDKEFGEGNGFGVRVGLWCRRILVVWGVSIVGSTGHFCSVNFSGTLK